jgi:sugar (pentulose or hexulose) kinase
MYLIGLDAGTTGCKAVVFDPDGQIHGYGFEEYGIITGEPAMAEQDAEAVWGAACRVLRQAIAAAIAAGVERGSLGALSLSVQGDAVIPVDRRLKPVYNTVLGLDYRCRPQVEACARRFGARRLFERTGMRPHPINSLAKLLWLKERRPEVYGRAWKIMTYADFLLARLGAEPVIDHTMASRTMAFDLCRRRWSAEILRPLGVDPELLSRPVPSGTSAGALSREAAEATGLPEGLLLVTGGHDQACAGLGAGIISEGMGVDSVGTSEVLSTAFTKPALGQAMYQGFYPCYLYTKGGMYFTFSLNHVGGLLLRWYRDTLASPEVAKAKETGRDPYEEILAGVPEGPSPLLVLPHFQGSGTPWCDLDSKGAILGLSLSSTRHDIVRAILEGLSYELGINLQAMGKAGITVRKLVVVGGGARSPLWLQIKADILGRPLATLETREAACLGAAILAGKAAGVYTSVDEGVGRCVREDRRYDPDSQRSERYQERFQLYREVYPKLAVLNRRL